MIKKFVNFILFALIAMSQVLSAQTLSSYEYWIDDDYAGRTSGANTSESLAFTVDASRMAWGLHTFNLRAVNDLDEKSAPMTRWFYIFDKAQASDDALACYEYWIDNDYAARINGTLSGEQTTLGLKISTEGLSQDYHLIHIRLGNQEGQWGETRHYVFYNLTEQKPLEPSKSVAYEYWYDEDFAHRVTKTFSASTLMFEADLSTLTDGLHFLHLRVMNDIDQWSTPQSFMFYTIAPTPQEPDLSVVGYRYMFNQESVFVPFRASTSQTIIREFSLPDVLDVCPIDASCTFTVTTSEVQLSRTAHIDFKLQFLNADGSWSMPVSKDYSEDCQVVHPYEQMECDKVLRHKKVQKGDFLATTITLGSGSDYLLSADQPCTMVLYNRRGQNLAEYQLVPGEGVSLSMETTLYCVIYATESDATYDKDEIRLLFSSTGKNVTSPLLYDINNDGTLDHTDVRCLADILLAKPAADQYDHNAADVNEDGKISISDITALLSKCFLPCPQYESRDFGISQTKQNE